MFALKSSTKNFKINIVYSCIQQLQYNTMLISFSVVWLKYQFYKKSCSDLFCATFQSRHFLVKPFLSVSYNFPNCRYFFPILLIPKIFTGYQKFFFISPHFPKISPAAQIFPGSRTFCITYFSFDSFASVRRAHRYLEMNDGRSK